MIYIIVIAVYLLALIGLGSYKASKVKTQSDFSIAGRSLGPWVLMGTMLATWIGTGSILGNAGKAYETGVAAFILPLGGVLGILLLTQIAGKARLSEKFTVPEIIGDRFGSGARLLSVIALVMAYMVIVSYQYNAGGAVLQTILVDDSGNPWLSPSTSTIIAAAIIVLYTLLAGLLSVAYTDVGNGIIMTISLVIAFPVLWVKAGGWDGMEAAFAARGLENHMRFWGTYSAVDILNFTLPPFLLVLGDANMYQRFFASKNAQGARSATRILVFAVALIELLVIASAWVSSSMIPDAANGRHVLIFASHRILPPFLGAIMLTTIVGIIISTADSYLLVPATTLNNAYPGCVYEIYQFTGFRKTDCFVQSPAGSGIGTDCLLGVPWFCGIHRIPGTSLVCLYDIRGGDYAHAGGGDFLERSHNRGIDCFDYYGNSHDLVMERNRFLSNFSPFHRMDYPTG
ncbi:MAG: sodium:solute symporter family protein [FCB group bacterium]|nr:sodium:solute symporter family protein [FCB group bacterium]